MNDSESTIDCEISDPRLFLHDMLAAEDRLAIFQWADQYRLSEELSRLLVHLSLQEGATVQETSDDSTISVSDARAMVPGTCLHVHLKKASWAAVWAVIPILIALIRSAFGDYSAHADVVAAVVAIVKLIPDTFHRLDSNQRQIYLAVAVLNRKAAGATVANLRLILSSLEDESFTGHFRMTEVELEQELSEMARQSILEKTGEYYRAT